ncbi:unnamed protein product, partial [Meganyctiphanes norvegica]
DDRATYVSRYGRASPSEQGPPQIKIRSSRFIGGSRYGKRSGVGLIQDTPSIPEDFIGGSRYGKRSGVGLIQDIPSISEDISGEVLGSSVLVGESVICLLVEQPDLFRCLRKPSGSELLEN